MNRLANEQSIYLLHAADQQIEWYPWSEEAFEAARSQNKPVFVSSGAVWCHWCHVMAKESFEDEETAALLNRLFISIKLDRDERPDIDRRLQQAVAAMGSGSGWPLTVFLTPAKEPFFGGTYFPLQEQQGRPGFKQVLTAVSTFYKTQKDEAVQYAASVMSVLKPEALHEEELSEGMLDEAEKNMLSLFDRENGGFGAAPKFPMPGALEFLLRRFSVRDYEPARNAVRMTLQGMARGGFHDHLGGGFHRYSVDAAWIIPHFEKMTDDNAGLLRNYIDGYSLLREDFLREVAEGIIRFTKEALADPAGGFYASQDADVTPDDEGGYFTWTKSELRGLLEPDEYAAIQYLVHPRGFLHGPVSRMVLAMNAEPREIAEITGKSIEAVHRTIRSGEEKLLKRRNMRTAPLIDKMLYTSLNGKMIASYLRAFMILNDSALREFAIKSLERVMRERVAGAVVYHAPGINGLLDDYIHLIDALLAAYEASAGQRFLARAEELTAACCEKFMDTAEGGFFDTEGDLLATRLKRIEDMPHPSANGVAISVLLKLGFITGKEGYRREAERALRIFAGAARTMNIHAGSYFCALDQYYRDSTLTVEAAADSALAAAARSAAARSYSLVRYEADRGRVISCSKGVCAEPVSDPAGIDVLLKNLGIR